METDPDSDWNRDFGEWNAENLHIHGIMYVPGLSHKYVIVTHPIIALLRYNQKLIGKSMDSFPIIDGQYYKVSIAVFDICCHTLKSSVLSVDGCVLAGDAT